MVNVFLSMALCALNIVGRDKGVGSVERGDMRVSDEVQVKKYIKVMSAKSGKVEIYETGE